MKILIINWRDPKSPLEGGAERFTQKYAEFWASEGHEVTWLTNSLAGASKKETKNKVSYIRIGPSLTGKLINYIFNYPIYLLKTILFANSYIKKNKIDLVIDEIHGFPFFTPLYSKARNVLLTCEVAGPIWDKMFPFPINKIGKFTEKLIYQIYKNTEIWAISENTKQNINQLLPGKKIKVIDLGVDENKEILNKIKDIKKTDFPSAVFLARLVKMKGIETAIELTADIVKEYPTFKLFVIGDGNKKYISFLKERINKLGLYKNVEFLGKVSELDKFRYLKKAHFLLHTSYKEGFGLTVIEAGLVGTPTLGRAGSNLNNLIKNEINGYTFKKQNEVLNLVKKVLKLKDVQIIVKISKEVTWDKVLKDFL